MANFRGPSKAPSQQNRNESNMSLKSNEEARDQRKLDKECVKQKIVDACQGLQWGNPNNIANLCQLLKQLAALSDLTLDTDIIESPEDFACLLKLLKKHRYGYCNITTCCEILTSLLKVSGSPYSTRSQAELLKELSEFWFTKSIYDEAITSAEQLATLANELGDKKLEAEAYYILIKPFVLKGWVEKAKLTLEKCVQCSEASEDELTIGYSKFATATMYYLEQNFEKALAEAENFLEIAKRLGDKLAECEVILQMGTIYCSLFDIQKALNLFSEGLAMATALGHQKKVMETQANKASLYSLMGKYHRAYNMGKSMVQKLENYEDKHIKYRILCNLGVVALIINENEESLELARKSLEVAEQLDAGEPIALAHGNIGLAQEKLKDYDGAIESYQNCLKSGKDIKDTRIINNSYCNLGRAYEGKGDKEKAKEYYLKALNMPQPPSSHWCDTEDFRFSPDYLLAKIAVEENDYSTAKKYFQQVVDRCEKFRKSVQDSPLKICFNDTQKKPFQYLQHVLLKEKADAAALLVGEMGRGRDFYDKVIKEDKSKQLNTPEALLNLAKINNQAVLFLSKLEVVQEMRMWFITPDGNVTSFECPLDQLENLLTKLRVVFSQALMGDMETANSNTQEVHIGDRQAAEESSEDALPPNLKNDNNPEAQPSQSYTTEFRGVDTKMVSDDESEDDYDEAGDESENNDHESTTTSENVAPKKNEQGTFGGTKEHTAHPPLISATTRGGDPAPNIPYLSDLVNKFSELIVRPIESHLKDLVSKTGLKPELLIIPQGQTFNIPYSTLRLKNGQPLCSLVAPREAFSFHSYSYSTKLQQQATSHLEHQMKDVLIVGNPTKNLKFAEKEANVIAEKLGATPLLTDSATRSEVLSRLTKAPIVHFACHGTLEGKSLLLAPEPGDSKAKLTVEDISNLILQANMVVLSACHTARGTISSEGVLGLARAFLMAGAKSVVTALWGVNDNATEKFMLKFYQNLRSEPVVNALASTMCEMKREKFKVEQWGSFKVLGANVKVLSSE